MSELLHTYGEETVTQHADCIILSGIRGDRCCNQMVIPLNGATNLFESDCVHTTSASAAMSRTNIPPVPISPAPHPQAFNVVHTITQENHNLSEPEKELLCWHQRLGHITFSKVKHLFRSGILSHIESTHRLHCCALAIANIAIPSLAQRDCDSLE